MAFSGFNQLDKLIVALSFGLAAALATSFVYSQRDEIFEWDWAKASGKFTAAPDEKLRLAARDFAEARAPGKACVERWVGKDEKFVYLALGCARFVEKLGEVRANNGDPNFTATRLRYQGEKIESIEQPQVKAYQNGLRRLFPLEAADKLRNLNSVPEFHRRGLARMTERGLSTFEN